MPKSKHMEEGNLDLMETELRLGLPGVAAAEAHESKVMAGEERNLSTEAMDTQFKVADGIGTHNAPPKSQAVGWPPVRSIRKINVAGRNVLVKVSMDGAPYLRKVDLRTYKSYYELSCALEKMFGCFTMGRRGSHGNNVMDVRSEYVGTYEDKEGDWMVVGDVPWEMFVDFCKRIRIVKVPEANIGLAPRTLEKWGTPISDGCECGRRA